MTSMKKLLKSAPAIEDIRKILKESDIIDILAGDDEMVVDLGIMHTLKNDGIPSRLRIPMEYDLMISFKDMLRNELSIPDDNIITKRKHSRDSTEINAFHIFINSQLFFDIDTYVAEVYYNPLIHKEFVDSLVAAVNQLRKKSARKADHFYLIVFQEKDLKIKRFQLKPFEIRVEDNYNDDFLPVHDIIYRSFREKKGKGVVLLHGEPGTGKTTYIRHLARTLNKKIVYIPPQFSVNLTSWAFLNLMMQHKDSVIIIEDAENIIEDRNAGRNFSISSLLNIADGLLSYCLNLRIICTFNTDLAKIDPALLRKGRLTALYEFKKLSVEKSRKLAEKTGLKIVIEKPMTLAEIYNYSDDDPQYSAGRKISFVP